MPGDNKGSRLPEEERRDRTKEISKKNDNWRSHGFFNFFDFFVIILIVVVVALLALGGRVLPSKQESGEQTAKSLTFDVCFENVDASFSSSVHTGDDVYSAQNGEYLGKVKSVSVVPHKEITLSQADTGTCIMKEIPGAVDMTVTVEANSIYESGIGYKIGENRIRMGGSLSCRFPGYYGTGVCIALTPQE